MASAYMRDMITKLANLGLLLEGENHEAAYVATDGAKALQTMVELCDAQLRWRRSERQVLRVIHGLASGVLAESRETIQEILNRPIFNAGSGYEPPAPPTKQEG
jgi:hypothetical protein